METREKNSTIFFNRVHPNSLRCKGLLVVEELEKGTIAKEQEQKNNN